MKDFAIGMLIGTAILCALGLPETDFVATISLSFYFTAYLFEN